MHHIPASFIEVCMLSGYKEFKVTSSPYKFLFIKALTNGIQAWEQTDKTTLISRLVKVRDIEDGENFLKSVGVWEQFEKEYNSTTKVENKIIPEDNFISGTIEKKSEKKVMSLKVDEKITSKSVEQINEHIQSVSKHRGRPKGSKNKPKEGKE